jgi:hypothetical protein
MATPATMKAPMPPEPATSYATLAFRDGVIFQRGAAMSATSRDFLISFDAEAQHYILEDLGNEKRWEDKRGSITHVPASNVRSANVKQEKKQ